MRGSTAEPTGGIPSLTPAEITQIYVEVFGRSPDGTELASEMENAMKYSAAGIERQIRNRGGNVAGSGLRGDEGAAPLTVPAPPPAISGNVITMGPAALAPAVTPTGPTGTLAAPNVYPIYPGGGYGGGGYNPGPLAPASGGLFGLDTTTLMIIAVAGAAAFYFLRK